MCRYCEIVPKYDDDWWDNYWDNEIDIGIQSCLTGLRMGVLRDGKNILQRQVMIEHFIILNIALSVGES